MKKILVLMLCVSAFVANVYSDALEGRWKSGETIIKIKKYENDQSKLKIVICPPDDNARAYVETRRVETWSDGVNKKYKLYAKACTWNSDLADVIEVGYAITKSGPGIIGISAGSRNFIATPVENRSSQQTSSSSQGQSLRDRVRSSRTTNVNQTATSQSNVNGNNNNSTMNVNGNNNQTIIINNYH